MAVDPTELVALLAVAAITAIVTRRLALPYTVGLVLVGAALAIARVDIRVPLTRDFIFDVVLPPLLFEAALNLRWADLRKDFGLILALSTFGTIASAAFVAAAMVFALHWPLGSALVFGALIAATDPVAVIALFKDMGMHGRLRTIVEAESLFNDAAAAILFSLALAFTAAPPSALDLGAAFAGSILGGLLIGAAAAGAALLLIGRTSDRLVEAALTTLAAYGAFFGAERAHVSGILAAVTAGLVMGNLGLGRDGRNSVSTGGRGFILGLWDFAAFLSNSAVFPLIGLNVARIGVRPDSIAPLAAAIAIVLAARALTVYPIALAFGRTGQAMALREQHVLWWGGLRGALGLALALSLPAALPFRDQIVLATFVVAAFSIIVQGLTMKPLMRRLGVAGDARR